MSKQLKSAFSELDAQHVGSHVYNRTNKQNYQSNSSFPKININDRQELDKTVKNKIQLKFLQYSMNQKQSLHSYFSSDQMQQFHDLKNNSILVEQHASLKIDVNSQNDRCQFYTGQISLLNFQDKPLTKLSRHKSSSDLFESQINNKINYKNNQQIKKVDQNIESQRKSYISSLHQIIDKNHLESPTKQCKIQELEQDLQHSDNKLQIRIEKDYQGQHRQEESNNRITPQRADNKNRQIGSQSFIRPVAIQVNKTNEERSSLQSPDKSPKRLQRPNQIQVRKIPSQLYESYDQIMMSVNKNAIKSPLKQKYKQNLRKQRQKNQRKSSTLSQSSMKVNFDEQLFASLPVIQGYCEVTVQNSHPVESKFIIYKNLIVFEDFKRLNIQSITKTKLIQKQRQQIKIKICYESSETQKSQVMIITLLSPSAQTYFSSSYDLFSQIVLRKLLLMNLAINELNQKKQLTSPNKSTDNSPLSSPISLPRALVRAPQIASLILQSQQRQYQSQLYKKSTFFSSWQKKHFSLSPSKGLQSFTSPPSIRQKQKPLAQLHRTTQIWTRFQLVYGYLVVKMWQNRLQKIQMGIPLCDFTNTEGQQNWLYGLSSNIVWGQF